MYAFLDTFFFLFHASWILFIMTGWLWRATRRVHLFLAVLTCLSWIGLGFFYGFGYCPFTTWQWDVKRALGETNLPNSYVKYYLDRWTGLDWNPHTINTAVAVVGLSALGLSTALNGRDWRRARV
jgi:hypothetical protein